MSYEKLLDEFIELERKRSRMGSGDDTFYERQIQDYINKQRSLWIGFIRFIHGEKIKRITAPLALTSCLLFLSGASFYVENVWYTLVVFMMGISSFYWLIKRIENV